jgi:putative ABC transport system ATP-binding protein
MGKDTIISLSDVKKIYIMGDTEVQALRGVTFCVEQGEFVSIMGPSGSGKSTCMNMIGCLDRPTSGDVAINGKLTAQMSEKELAHLRNETVGFVFQQYHLLSNMTVLENVMLPLRYQGLSVPERRERAEESLKIVGLEDRMRHRPSELSGGQKQRVAIARAIATRPKIILADEPTGALDSETGKNVMNLFRQINKTGTTVVVITHDPGIGHSANRVMKIFDGKIASDEKTDNNLATHPNTDESLFEEALKSEKATSREENANV